MSMSNSYTQQRSSQVAIMTGPRAMPHDGVAVTRRLDRSLWSLQELLDVLPGADRLRIDTPFEASWTMPPVLHATGRLSGSGMRIARSTRVVLELMAWSGGTTELRLRPLTHRVPNWSQRRRRRYFDAAHDTMDELLRLLGGAAASRDAVVHELSDPASPATTFEDHPRERRAAS